MQVIKKKGIKPSVDFHPSLVPAHIMHNPKVPKDSKCTKIYMKLCCIIFQKMILLELFENGFCLFGSVKSSGTHNLAHTYHIIKETIL